MLSDRVLQLFRDVIRGIEKEEMPVIERVAGEIVRRVAEGGAVHLHDTGHLVDRELVHRAGGLALWRPLRWNLEVTNPVRSRGGEDGGVDPEQLVGCVLAASRVRPGDVLIAGSVSGAGAAVVELVLRARDMGVFTVALTSPEYSSRLEPGHSSRLRLFEAAHEVIDNQAPYGDAALGGEGIPENMIPASGIGAVTAMWALTAQVTERLLARGLQPSTYASVNRPDTKEFNQGSEERYEKHGW